MSDYLKLERQLCFKIYASHRKITKDYKDLLDKINLTYPQYLVLLVLWEKDNLTVKDLGEKLFLDSGTLSPLIKNLSTKNLVTKTRDLVDERVVNISLTQAGKDLKEKAQEIPVEMYKKTPVNEEEYKFLMEILSRFISE